MSRLFILIAALTFALVLFARDSGAYNAWSGEQRKWPWRAETSHQVTTAPNTGYHLLETNTYAIDIGMAYAPVHSISGGAKLSYQDVNCAGWTLTIADTEGSYIKYKHLSSDTAVSGEIVQGQIIATSGNSGSEDNTPQFTCSTAAHLHFQRDTSATPDTTTDISLEPIGGVSSVTQDASYPSDNAGIGDACGNATSPCTEDMTIDGTSYIVFRDAFTQQNRYNGPGVTWDPCGAPGSFSPNDKGCWWARPETSGVTGFPGVQQNFIGGPGPGEGV